MLDKKHRPVYIASLDQEKAFGGVKIQFLTDILQHMNFGSYFITWINTLYSKITIHLLNNGYLSNHIIVRRGVLHGRMDGSATFEFVFHYFFSASPKFVFHYIFTTSPTFVIRYIFTTF